MNIGTNRYPLEKKLIRLNYKNLYNRIYDYNLQLFNLFR